MLATAGGKTKTSLPTARKALSSATTYNEATAANSAGLPRARRTSGCTGAVGAISSGVMAAMDVTAATHHRAKV